MECPYCREKIQDQAVICKHCGRDLGFIRPLIDRVLALETEMRAPAKAPASSDEDTPRFAVLVTLGLVICWLWTASTYGSAFRVDWIPDELPFLLTAMMPPALFGFLAGRSLRNRPTVTLVGWGALLGLVSVGIVVVVIASVGAVNWPWILLVFNVGQPAIFASAGWLGKLVAIPGRLDLSRVKSLLGSAQFLLATAAQVAAQIATFHSLVKLFGGSS